MNKQGVIHRFSESRAKGWIMLEMVLCLALFAVVLLVLQRQSEAQWQSLQQAETERKHNENQLKQAAMSQLTGASTWLDIPSTSKQAYPDCQVCTGNQLKRWFYASQHVEPEFATLSLHDEGDQ